MKEYRKSSKLDNVCYDIRGPVLDEADRMEEEGHQILKLNIGNPAPYDLLAPDEVIHDVMHNLRYAQGYCCSQGIFPARKAIMQHCQEIGIPGVDVDDIYLGNGVSELIMMSMQGLLDRGDEVLVPAPDYPLWTAAINLSGGTAVHYLCDEQSDWVPGVADMASKITEKTKGIVVINPNNPTGAVYPREILEQIVRLAEEHGLILFCDEIYEQVLYDGLKHVPVGSLTEDVLVVTLSGLSKSHRVAGFRVGWMILSGNKDMAKGYIEGIKMLSSMRLCSNVPAQHAVQTSLGGYQSIEDLIKPGGRLYEQRQYAWERLNNIPGVSCVKPKGALYLFPKLDTKRFHIDDDEQFVFDFLREEKVLLVQGTGFNWPDPDHFRIVFLPRLEDLEAALDKLEHFLSDYQQK
jgi:alanine-synthesizing transaminase